MRAKHCMHQGATDCATFFPVHDRSRFKETTIGYLDAPEAP